MFPFPSGSSRGASTRAPSSGLGAPPTRPSRTDHTVSSFEDRARACALSRTQSHPHKAARKEKRRGRESTQERKGKKCPRLAAEKCARVLLVYVSHSFTLLEAGTPLHTPKTTNGRKKKIGSVCSRLERAAGRRTASPLPALQLSAIGSAFNMLQNTREKASGADTCGGVNSLRGVL